MADHIVIPTTLAALKEQQTAHKAFQQYYESRYVLSGSGTATYVDGVSDIVFFLGVNGDPNDTVVGVPDGFNGVVRIFCTINAAYDGTPETASSAVEEDAISVNASGTLTYDPGTSGELISETTTNKIAVDVENVTNGFKVKISKTSVAASVEVLGYCRVHIIGAVTLVGDNFISEFPQMTETTAASG